MAIDPNAIAQAQRDHYARKDEGNNEIMDNINKVISKQYENELLATGTTIQSIDTALKSLDMLDTDIQFDMVNNLITDLEQNHTLGAKGKAYLPIAKNLYKTKLQNKNDRDALLSEMDTDYNTFLEHAKGDDLGVYDTETASAIRDDIHNSINQNSKYLTGNDITKYNNAIKVIDNWVMSGNLLKGLDDKPLEVRDLSTIGALDTDGDSIGLPDTGFSPFQFTSYNKNDANRAKGNVDNTTIAFNTKHPDHVESIWSEDEKNNLNSAWANNTKMFDGLNNQGTFGVWLNNAVTTGQLTGVNLDFSSNYVGGDATKGAYVGASWQGVQDIFDDQETFEEALYMYTKALNVDYLNSMYYDTQGNFFGTPNNLNEQYSGSLTTGTTSLTNMQYLENAYRDFSMIMGNTIGFHNVSDYNNLFNPETVGFNPSDNSVGAAIVQNELFKIAHESYALGDGASADYWIKQANNSLLSTYNITQQVTAQNLKKDQDQNWLDYTLRLNSLSEDDIQSIGGALQILDPNELAEYTKDWDGQGVKMGIFTDILTGQAAGKFQSGDTQNPFNAFNQVFVGNTKQKIKTWNNDIETHLKSVDNLGFKGNNSLNSEIYNVIPWDKTFTPGIDYINDKGEVNDVAIDNVQNQIFQNTKGVFNYIDGAWTNVPGDFQTEFKNVWKAENESEFNVAITALRNDSDAFLYNTIEGTYAMSDNMRDWFLSNGGGTAEENQSLVTYIENMVNAYSYLDNFETVQQTATQTTSQFLAKYKKTN